MNRPNTGHGRDLCVGCLDSWHAAPCGDLGVIALPGEGDVAIRVHRGRPGRRAPRPADQPPEGRPRLEWMSDGLLVLLPCLVAWVVTVAGGPEARWQLFALAFAQSLALVWYRRFPLAVLVGVTGIELVLAVTGQPVFVGVVVAVSGLGAWGPPRHQRLGVAFGLGVLVLILVHGLLTKDANLVVHGAAFVVVTVIFLGFWLIGRLGAGQRQRIRELQAYSRRLKAERELFERQAAERERALLARELHDILNHSMTAMVLDADAAADSGDSAEARATLRRVAETGRDSLAELRRLLGVLRKGPSGADHDPLVVPPRLAQLDELVASLPEGGPRVRLERLGDVRVLAASIELAAYRVVQESLTNVTKHAGPVDVEVSLTYSPEGLAVRVANTAGTGPAAVAAQGSGGMGLAGMRERVEIVGGSFEAGPRPAGGFALRVFLPVRSVS